MDVSGAMEIFSRSIVGLVLPEGYSFGLVFSSCGVGRGVSTNCFLRLAISTYSCFTLNLKVLFSPSVLDKLACYLMVPFPLDTSASFMFRRVFSFLILSTISVNSLEEPFCSSRLLMSLLISF